MKGSFMNSTIRRIKRSLRDCQLQPSFGLCLFEEGYCLDFLGFLIALPFLDRWYREPTEIMESWGIQYFERSIMLSWGRKCKFIQMPWSLEHVKWEVMQPDGKFALKDRSYSGDPKDGRWIAEYTYHYKLRNDQVQVRTATVYVERGYWHWLLAKWLRLPLWLPVVNMMQQSIEIKFNDEVGERTGSWKGGCIGCGWTMLPGETAEQSLRRMENERKFN